MATDPIEQQLLFTDMFHADDLCLAGDLGELLSPDFIKEFLSDGDDVALNKLSTSDEVVSSYDRAGSPEVTSMCAPAATAAGLVSSASAAEPVPLSLLMAWPANMVTTAIQQQAPAQVVAPTAAASPQAAAVGAVTLRRRSSGPSSSCSSDCGNISHHHHHSPANPSATSSGDSPAATANTADGAATKLTRMQAAAAKRKAPEVDWRAITDPAERRKQRRLAKNRVTAARSRERKKAAWGEMEGTMSQLQSDNAQLRAAMEAMAKENARLQAALASLSRGAGAVGGAACVGGGATEPAVLACLAIMHLVRLLPTRAAERAFLLLLLAFVATDAALQAVTLFGLSSGAFATFASLAACCSPLVCMTERLSWLQPALAVRARVRRRHNASASCFARESTQFGWDACTAHKAAGRSHHPASSLGFNRTGLGCDDGNLTWQHLGLHHAAAHAA